MVIANQGSTKIAIANAAKKNSGTIAALTLGDIIPKAIGLFFFILCFLSLSTSKISLKIYTLEDTKQKDIKAPE